MKKYIATIVVSFLMAGMINANAQNEGHGRTDRTPEQRMEMQAQRVASTLMLSDEVSASFITMYKEYRAALKAVNDKYRPARRTEDQKGTPMKDAEVDARIRNEFAKSQAILDTRIAYYEKFLTILSPKQIKKIYEIEKEQAEKAAERHNGRR